MKKRLVSIILTVFLVLSMMPFAAFADNAIVCPACGGEVTKKQYHLVGNYWDFYQCNTCGKWAYLSGVAGLKLFSAGDQAIINAADANAILNFAFNNGHLIPATKAPSGVGRKDLPGYCDTGDGTSTPQVDSNGKFVDGWYTLPPNMIIRISLPVMVVIMQAVNIILKPLQINSMLLLLVRRFLFLPHTQTVLLVLQMDTLAIIFIFIGK